MPNEPKSCPFRPAGTIRCCDVGCALYDKLREQCVLVVMADALNEIARQIYFRNERGK